MKLYRLKPGAEGYKFYIPGMAYDQDEAGEVISVDYLVNNYPQDWEEVGEEVPPNDPERIVLKLKEKPELLNLPLEDIMKL